MSDATWIRISDQQDRRWSSQAVVLGGQDARLTSLAFCSRYSRDAHYADLPDSQGVLHWITQKQMRLAGIVARMAVTHEHGTMREMAREAQCCASTVSRTIVKLQGWGLYKIDVVRGRHGGVQIVAGRFEAYVERARQKLREWAQKVRDRAQRINVASTLETYRKEGEEVKKSLFSMDATFRDFMAWREDHGDETAEPERSERLESDHLGASADGDGGSEG